MPYNFRFFAGGLYLTKPLGILFGTVNNILALLIRSDAKKYGFYSSENFSVYVFVTTFVVSYSNTILVATTLLFNDLHYGSIDFYYYFGQMIIVTTLTTNSLPYIGVLLDLMVHKWCCCRKDLHTARSES